MAFSPLQQSLLTSACVSSVLFGLSTVPLAVFGSQPVEVEIQNQSVLNTEISDLAGPYLGIAGAMSAALGFGILGIGGWRSAANRSEAEQAKRLDVERSLLAREAELERIKFSDTRLRAEKLDGFLQPEAPSTVRHSAAAFAPSTVATHASHERAQNLPAHSQPYSSHSVNSFDPAPAVVEKLGHTHSGLSSAETFTPHLYTANAQLAGHLGASTISDEKTSHAARKDESEQQMEVVLGHLRDLMQRVESLQAGDSGRMAA